MTKPKRPPKNPNYREPNFDTIIIDLRRKRRMLERERAERDWERKQPLWYRLFFGKYD